MRGAMALLGGVALVMGLLAGLLGTAPRPL